MLQLNYEAFQKAQETLLHAKVDRVSVWSVAKPKQEAENEFLQKNGREAYSKWFLAQDSEKAENSKERYQFLYGDFEKIHRSALLAIQEIAEAQNYPNIVIAVKELLREIDKEPDIVEITSDDSFPASDPPNY